MEWRWQYFTPKEVLSPDGLKMLRRNNLKVQGFALDNLEAYRRWLALPIMCNHGQLHHRGWRSTKENRRIGGVLDSPHVQGIAFDLNCYSLTLSQFALTMLKYTSNQIDSTKGRKSFSHKGFRAIGIYPKKNFIHVDFRTLPAYEETYLVAWNGDNQKATLFNREDLSGTREELLTLLKTSLDLPNNWKV